MLVRALFAAAALGALCLIAVPTLVSASTSPAGGELCQGYGGCNRGPYTSHDYQAHEYTSYWRSSAGDECTNYVAFVESTVYHVPQPDYLLGNAADWPATAAAHGVAVNGTPSVGAVAVFNGSDPGIGPEGHVAVVEEVGPHDSWIVISQQHIYSDVDGYDWTLIDPANPGSGWEAWPAYFIHFAQVAPAPPPPPAHPIADLASDGGFDLHGGGGWQRSADSSFSVLDAAEGHGTTPYEGNGFAATATTVSGGGFYQDVDLPIGDDETFCADAEVVTLGDATGARGTLALWLLGGSAGQNSATNFGPLSGGADWRQVTTCVTSGGSHAELRIQFYDAPRTPTLAIDAVDVHESYSAGGGFGTSSGDGWTRAASSNFVIVSGDKGGTAPYADNGYALTNTSISGGGIYEDEQLPIGAGESLCADAEVVTDGPRTGARGTIALWLLGGARQSSSSNFGPLPGGSAWRTVVTCIRATSAHDELRLQFFDAPHTPTLAVDAVDVHRSFVGDAGAPGWEREPGSALEVMHAEPRLATYPFEDGLYAATSTIVSGGGVFEDSAESIAPGESFCASAEVVTMGATAGAKGTMVLWLLGDTAPQESNIGFGPLPGGDDWRPLSTCVTASGAHDMLRIQFYDAPHTPTLAVDAVDVR